MTLLLSLIDNQITWIVVWISVFILALIIELTTEQLVSIWFCGSAVICLILAIFSVPWWIHLIVFILASSILLVVSRFLIKKDQQKSVPTNTDSLIGQEIKIIKEVTSSSYGEGKVRDVVWSILSKEGEIKEGEIAIIENIEGNHLIVRRKEN